MGDFPSVGFTGFQKNEPFGAGGIAVSGSNNTKGSWSQLVASTARDYHGLWLTMSSSSSTAVSYLLDLGIGAAASEVVLVPNLFIYGPPAIKTTIGPIYVPVFVPAGSRLSARGQCSTNSKVFDFDAQGLSGGLIVPSGLGLCTDYGSDTANSRGTAVVSGSANAKGSWTQITASCDDISALIIMTGSVNDISTNYFLFDVAVGGSGSEVEILSQIRGSQYDINGLTTPGAYCFPLRIPAGTRISVRLQHGTATRTIYFSMIGVK